MLTVWNRYIPKSGANKKWTEWFLNEVFDNRNAGLNYCQAGQENAFGWAAMKDGYTMQAELFEKARSQGKITFELAGETGRRFKKMYKNTPVSSTDAHKDGRSSFWYNSKYYRSSVYYNKGEILIRDLTIFDERYKERYLNDITTDESVFYDNLPLIDCFKWSDAENTGGMFFEYGGEIVSDAGDFKTVKNNDESISVAVPSKHGDIVISYKEKSVDFSFPKPGFVMKTVMYKGRTTVKEYAGGEVHCEYEGFKYKIGLRGAECLVHSGGFEFAVSGKSAGLVF